MNLGPRTKVSDPAYKLLEDDFTTTPVFNEFDCYICQDPEFSKMGLPLCYSCQFCKGHVPADDPVCWDCGKEQGPC